MSDCANLSRASMVAQAVVLIAVLYLVYLTVYQKERYLGSGLADNVQVYTSGATLRRLGQKFSSTNQGVYTTIHNAEINGGDPVPVVVFPAEKVPANLITY